MKFLIKSGTAVFDNCNLHVREKRTKHKRIGNDTNICTETINFNKTLLDKQPYMYSVFYPTVARRIIEKEVELPVES